MATLTVLTDYKATCNRCGHVQKLLDLSPEDLAEVENAPLSPRARQIAFRYLLSLAMANHTEPGVRWPGWRTCAAKASDYTMSGRTMYAPGADAW